MTLRTAIAAPVAAPVTERLAPAVLLLGGVPVLTVLVMSAVRYVASGTLGPVG
jgi:hypothetical protein